MYHGRRMVALVEPRGDLLAVRLEHRHLWRHTMHRLRRHHTAALG